jgi:hypothetical protein
LSQAPICCMRCTEVKAIIFSARCWLDEPIDLPEAFRMEHGRVKPQGGYTGATAARVTCI